MERLENRWNLILFLFVSISFVLYRVSSYVWNYVRRGQRQVMDSPSTHITTLELPLPRLSPFRPVTSSLCNVDGHRSNGIISKAIFTDRQGWNLGAVEGYFIGGDVQSWWSSQKRERERESARGGWTRGREQSYRVLERELFCHTHDSTPLIRNRSFIIIWYDRLALVHREKKPWTLLFFPPIYFLFRVDIFFNSLSFIASKCTKFHVTWHIFKCHSNFRKYRQNLFPVSTKSCRKKLSWNLRKIEKLFRFESLKLL